MFIVIPTCDTHAAIAAISLRLLARYWRGHPPVHVLHDAVAPNIAGLPGIDLHDCGRETESPWLERMVRFLRIREDELFLLVLDDYAMCGPARVELIASGERLMREDESVGMFPLCWYPAARREPRSGCDGIVTLRGTPILLQAAIWRRSWFLELAAQMDPRTSAWGFETAATQWAKRCRREICSADIPEPRYVGGHLVDGFEKGDWPLPYHNLMHRGEPVEMYEGFLRKEGLAFASRGMGDTVAKVAQATGVARVVGAIEAMTGRECGCGQRRRELNRVKPY
jgi:hypothetical protein